MLRDSEIPLERRRYLLMTLALTAILYGTNTWPAITQKEQKSMHTTLMRAYRYVLPAAHSGRRHLLKTDLQILEELQLPLPSNYMRVMRITLLCRLLIGKHHTLLYLAQMSLSNSKSWMVQTLQSVRDLWPWINAKSTNPAPDIRQAAQWV